MSCPAAPGVCVRTGRGGPGGRGRSLGRTAPGPGARPGQAGQSFSAAVAAEGQARRTGETGLAAPNSGSAGPGRRAVVDAGSLLVVVVAARELDEAGWLVTDGPGVMARRQEHDVARG